MPSLLIIVGFLALVLFAHSAYRLAVNAYYARKTKLPYLIIPIDQNSFFWMLCAVPLRPLLKKRLPQWVWERVSITIYGFEFHEKLRVYQQYGAPQGNDKSYLIVTPGKLEFSTIDPEIADHVLRRPRDFIQSDINDLFMGRFGPNVLTTNGDEWARQRKVVASVINERVSKAVFEESVRHTKGLLKEVLDDNQEAGETRRMFDMMKKITVNVLSGAGMGAKVEWTDKERPQPGFQTTFIQSVQSVLNAITGPIVLPRWVLSNYPGFLPGHEVLNTLGHAMEEFPKHTRAMLAQERNRSSAAGAHSGNNIMSQLLQASADHRETGGKGGKPLSEEEMIGNLFVFTGAGFDTTANTLAYALTLLCRYPQWQDWIFEEIDRIMPKDVDTELEYATIIPKATRTLCCMLETLRLFTPVIHIFKCTNGTQTIQSSRGSFDLPHNTTVYVNGVGLHIQPTLWRNLNLAEKEEASEDDELQFRPTRWINQSDEGQHIFQPPKGSYVPWSAGPRVCPGQKMAQVEFTAIFLTMFRHHRIEAVPLKKGRKGMLETRPELEHRLDERMKDSMSILTLQMNDVYDLSEGDEKGLLLRLTKRR